ncbi:ion transporter [Nocardiopsis coralliicola]
MRTRVRAFVDAPLFQRVIVTLILANGVTLGLETWPSVLAEHGGLLYLADRALLAVFTAEIALRWYAYGRAFFRDPWNVFDLAIISLALMPATGPFSVLRVLRVLRLLRLLSVIPSLRLVVTGLFRALPGMASISLLLLLLLYVSGVMATKVFAEAAPQYFGDLWTSLFTLFQITTGDGWSTIALEVMEDQPLAWIFFVIFILVSTFIALNLFIAVAVQALEHGADDDRPAHPPLSPPPPGAGPDQGGPPPEDRPGGTERPAAADEILAELRALRAEVAELRADRSGARDDEPAVR